MTLVQLVIPLLLLHWIVLSNPLLTFILVAIHHCVLILYVMQTIVLVEVFTRSHEIQIIEFLKVLIIYLDVHIAYCVILNILFLLVLVYYRIQVDTVFGLSFSSLALQTLIVDFLQTAVFVVSLYFIVVDLNMDSFILWIIDLGLTDFGDCFLFRVAT